MGLNSYQAHELVSWPYSNRVAASVWTIRCLGNPDCEGSDVAVAAILARREQLQRQKSNEELTLRNGAKRNGGSVE